MTRVLHATLIALLAAFLAACSTSLGGVSPSDPEALRSNNPKLYAELKNKSVDGHRNLILPDWLNDDPVLHEDPDKLSPVEVARAIVLAQANGDSVLDYQLGSDAFRAAADQTSWFWSPSPEIANWKTQITSVKIVGETQQDEWCVIVLEVESNTISSSYPDGAHLVWYSTVTLHREHGAWKVYRDQNHVIEEQPLPADAFSLSTSSH
ncbi:MAG: hypothetical protein IRY83_15595 [Chloroflexi bacterium]|nr:hypothetical protein [Chloroflexota bacterium]